ncbi:hypothetical protein SEA_JFLIX2_105 [Rhodococcus phage Jflix2]|nr:hypothetical protein SEA_JFLIX2_105 [Rhodococcus phage Jflix2]
MNNNGRIILAAIAAGTIGLGVGIAIVPVQAPATVTPVAITGDDNSDGIIDEDESGWNCETMGNRICGPADYSIDECEDWTYTFNIDGILVRAPRVSPELPVCAPN